MTRQDVTWVLELIKNRDARTDAERDAIDMAIEALEMQCNLIRCKNCSHYSVHAGDYMCGLNVLAYVRKDDFCSRGERKEV